MKLLETDRFILRTWIDDNLQPMFIINQDPKKMEYFPGFKLEDEMNNLSLSMQHLYIFNEGFSLIHLTQNTLSK